MPNDKRFTSSRQRQKGKNERYNYQGHPKEKKKPLPNPLLRKERGKSPPFKPGHLGGQTGMDTAGWYRQDSVSFLRRRQALRVQSHSLLRIRMFSLSGLRGLRPERKYDRMTFYAIEADSINAFPVFGSTKNTKDFFAKQ